MGPACLRPTEAPAPGGQLRVGALTSSGHLSKLQCPGCGRGCGDRPHSPLLLLSAGEEAARRQCLASLALMRDRIVPPAPRIRALLLSNRVPFPPHPVPLCPVIWPCCFQHLPSHPVQTPLFFWLLPAAGTWSTRPGLSQQGQEWGWGAGPEGGTQGKACGCLLGGKSWHIKGCAL